MCPGAAAQEVKLDILMCSGHSPEMAVSEQLLFLGISDKKGEKGKQGSGGQREVVRIPREAEEPSWTLSPSVFAYTWSR